MSPHQGELHSPDRVRGAGGWPADRLPGGGLGLPRQDGAEGEVFTVLMRVYRLFQPDPETGEISEESEEYVVRDTPLLVNIKGELHLVSSSNECPVSRLWIPA